MNPGQLIAFLNSIGCGELDAIMAKLAEARKGCEQLEQRDLGALLDEAGQALRSGDPKTFRKKIETVVARLGHVKEVEE